MKDYANRNENFIDVQKSLYKQKVVMWLERVEVTLFIIVAAYFVSTLTN